MWITFKVQTYNSKFELSSKWILTKNPNLKKFFLEGAGIPTDKRKTQKTIGTG